MTAYLQHCETVRTVSMSSLAELQHCVQRSANHVNEVDLIVTGVY